MIFCLPSPLGDRPLTYTHWGSDLGKEAGIAGIDQVMLHEQATAAFVTSNTAKFISDQRHVSIMGQRGVVPHVS